MSMIFVSDLLDSPGKIELEAAAVLPGRHLRHLVPARATARRAKSDPVADDRGPTIMSRPASAGAMPVSRRFFLTRGAGALSITFLAAPAAGQELAPFDMAALKEGYRRRVTAIKDAGMLPVIDIESSCNPQKLDLAAFARAMDRAGIAQMALSVDVPGSLYERGERWGHHVHDFVRNYPDRFIPVGNGGNHPAWTRHPDTFLDDNERWIAAHRYPLMGEFEFRHYPSPRQFDRGETFRDVNMALDGPAGHRLFSFAEQSGVPFQIHYEVEDGLLPVLAAMLARYPRAKVIWCHLAQVRFAERASRYSPSFVRELLLKHPNLYIDTAFGGPGSVYKPSGQKHARVWNSSGQVDRAWRDVITELPYRFLAAIDIGGDRLDRLEEWTANLRKFLAELPRPARDIVAHGAAWKLLFGEELPP
ncbi:MAG: amidohydrolase family protein [Alphaproteobacteria bacterium]|nr:amidohydrolase family protein [Alphaproteobacteria bacterium]